MLSIEYINELILKYAASPYGKKRIKEKTGYDHVSFDPKQKINISAYCAEMKDILHSYISYYVKSIERNDIIIGESKKDKLGNISVPIYIQKDALFRESLVPNYDWKGNNVTKIGGKSGIANIILHFDKGWNAEGSVFGTWKGRYGDRNDSTYSVPHRAPSNFLNDAIEEFNRIAKGVAYASLGDEYK